MSFTFTRAPSSAGAWVSAGSCKRARIIQQPVVALHASTSQPSATSQQDASSTARQPLKPLQPAAQSQTQPSPELWHELLGADEDEPFNARARSASDAAVLRRKGHLKEQDFLIEFLLRMHETHTCQVGRAPALFCCVSRPVSMLNWLPSQELLHMRLHDTVVTLKLVVASFDDRDS